MTTNLTSISTFGWYSDSIISDQLFNISPFGWFADVVVIPPEVCTTWHNALITGLRILLDDTDAVIYTDPQLEDTLALAASMVQQEVNLDYDYNIGITPPSISPDPIVNGDKDFVNLVSLKAACLLDKSLLGYNNTIAGFSAKYGKTYMSTINRASSFDSFMNSGYCISYENAKKQFGSRNQKSILSPFTNKNFDPLNYKR